MRFGLFVPPFGWLSRPAALVRLAADAEGAGWDGVFLWDHILYGDGLPVADPWVALAAMACATERIRLGPMVTPLARRRPWVVARQAVTLDHLSDGRVTLGVGLGSDRSREFEAFGEVRDLRERAQQLDEALDVITGLWSGEALTYRGRHLGVDAVRFLPRAVQSPRIPIWVAAVLPNRAPLRRAARYDGIFPLSRSGGFRAAEQMLVGDVRRMLAHIESHRSGAGAFDVVLRGRSGPHWSREDLAALRELESAGVTWWLETVGQPQGVGFGVTEPEESVFELVRAGPPSL